ncbi:MAG: tandem-95 repeat protein [Pseudomonadales bacterium]|nr:tandem-95 repeat protein [Pseudomonadales bacterium]
MLNRNTLLISTISFSVLPFMPNAFAAGQSQAAPPPLSPGFAKGMPAALNDLPTSKLRAAIKNLPPAAQQNAMSWLQSFSFPSADIDYLHADKEGAIYYIDTETVEAPVEVSAEELAAMQSTTAAADNAFALHSRLGAANTVYLDFNGHVIQGTAWNSGTAATLYAQAFDLDGDPTTFNASERQRIAETWHRIAEDYAAFDIDVTTEDPVIFGPTVGRLLITRDDDATGQAMPYKGAGGVAYVGVWGLSYYEYYSPALVYYNKLGNGSPAYMAEASSHELGHNLALSHDGSSSSSYYTGHGSGNVSWAPIMGVGYYRNVTQWSMGEYADANNFQNDTAILSAQLSYRSDDHSNQANTATPLTLAGDGSITATNPENDAANVQSDNKGLIETQADIDFFAFDAAAGPIDISATPAWQAYYLANLRGANLDIRLALYNVNDLSTPIIASDPIDDTFARIQTTVAAGSYVIAVTGEGNSVSPYSDYASLGMYFLSGSVTPASEQPGNNAPVANNDAATIDEDAMGAITVLVNDSDADGDTLNIIAVSSANNGLVTINGSQLQYTPANDFNGNDSFSYTISDGMGGSAQATVTMTVNAVNDAPQASNDNANLDQDTAMTIQVLSNDSDIDDAASALFISVTTASSNGSVLISTDQKSLNYTPAAGFSGSDNFSYTVSDAAGATATATVTITVNAVIATPQAPDSVMIVNGSDGTATVSWSDNSNNEDGFELERQKLHKNGSFNGSTLISAATNSTSLVDSSGNGSFRYRARALNGATSSSWSEWSTLVEITGAVKGGNKDSGSGGKGGGKKK